MDPRVAALTRRFPAVADVVAPLSTALGGDEDAVYAALCDMVAGASGSEASDACAEEHAPQTPATAGGECADTGPAAPAAAGDAELALYEEAFQQLDIRADEEFAVRLSGEDAAAAASEAAHQPHGSWWKPASFAAPAAGGGGGGDRGSAAAGNGGNPAAHLSYAGRAGVERIMNRFAWADRALVVHCYEAAGENEALAEELLCGACPEVVDIAHDPAKDRRSRAPLAGEGVVRSSDLKGVGRNPARRPRQSNAATLQSVRSEEGGGTGRPQLRSPSVSIAEQLRQRDIAELAEAARVGSATMGCETELNSLRNKLKESSIQRDRYQALYMKTRNKLHEQESMRYGADANRTWRELLPWLVRSSSSSVDLHFLTGDQALEAVDAKLAQVQGRPGKLRFITGRGNNSANGAVLRPRIQRHLTDRGITHSIDSTGGVVIVKLTR